MKVWIVMGIGSALGKRHAGKALVVVIAYPFEIRILGMVGLNQHLAGLVGAAGATGHLYDLLEKVLGGAEIQAEQSLVHVEHAHQRDVRKVVPFGQHLGTDQQPGVPAAYHVTHPLEFAAPGRAVTIDPHQAGTGKQGLERLFDALGSLAAGEQLLVTALGANAQLRLAETAVVTA